MIDKLTTIAAVEAVEKLIVEVKLALDSAERFHQITRRKQDQAADQASSEPPAQRPALAESSASTSSSTSSSKTAKSDDTEETEKTEKSEETEESEETFVRQRMQPKQQTSEEHALRMRHCQHNRQMIDKLAAAVAHILNDYTTDLKEHHRIDEGARLLEVVQGIDDCLANGHWQQGLFFRTIGDRLSKAREQFHEHAMLWHAYVHDESGSGNKGGKAGSGGSQTGERQGAALKTVYVSLYQAGGQELKNWQYMLSHLAEHTMGRPAYAQREDVEGFVRSRPVPSNEAYLVANVFEKDIISGLDKGSPREDAAGRPMISLNKGAIKLENIQEFVHATGAYRIREGKLVRLDADERN